MYPSSCFMTTVMQMSHNRKHHNDIFTLKHNVANGTHTVLKGWPGWPVPPPQYDWPPLIAPHNFWNIGLQTRGHSSSKTFFNSLHMVINKCVSELYSYFIFYRSNVSTFSQWLCAEQTGWNCTKQVRTWLTCYSLPYLCYFLHLSGILKNLDAFPPRLPG